MGVSRTMSTKHLAKKLRYIRDELGRNEGSTITQQEMIRRLAIHDKRISKLPKQNISSWETGHRVPPPPVLLAYARVAGVCMERIVDDSLDMPKSLPVHEGHDTDS
jgi:hypothetical protein